MVIETAGLPPAEEPALPPEEPTSTPTIEPSATTAPTEGVDAATLQRDTLDVTVTIWNGSTLPTGIEWSLELAPGYGDTVPYAQIGDTYGTLSGPHLQLSLPEAGYVLTINGSWSASLMDGTERVHLYPGETTAITVELQPRPTASGSLCFQFPGLSQTGGQPLLCIEGRACSGNWSWYRLDPGDYVWSAALRGFRTGTGTASILSGQTVSGTLVIPPLVASQAGSVTIELEMADGSAPSAAVYLQVCLDRVNAAGTRQCLSPTYLPASVTFADVPAGVIGYTVETTGVIQSIAAGEVTVPLGVR